MTRVLVIDDEAPIRLLCRVNLEAEGMEVLEASDGPTGLEKARNDEPDVILLDVMMPGLDGWQVAEELLDSDVTSAIPIVFLTARAEVRDRARGLDLGGIDYVTKPFNPVELAPLVLALIERVDRGERDELRREKIAELRDLIEPVCSANPPPAAGEVGRDHQRARAAAERASQRADAHDSEARIEQVPPVLGARHPHPDDGAGLCEPAHRPGEVLSDPGSAHAEATDAGADSAVEDGTRAEHLRGVRASGALEARVGVERAHVVGQPHLVHGGQQGRLRVSHGGRLGFADQYECGHVRSRTSQYSPGHE